VFCICDVGIGQARLVSSNVTRLAPHWGLQAGIRHSTDSSAAAGFRRKTGKEGADLDSRELIVFQRFTKASVGLKVLNKVLND
jgi:hypothetical protein